MKTLKLKMMRKLMMTVALVATVFAASANEWADSATGLTWSYDVVGDAAMIAGYEDGEVRVVAGERGWYWSSDATDATYAWGLCLRDFSAFNPSVHDQNFRYLGYPVRAVR